VATALLSFLALAADGAWALLTIRQRLGTAAEHLRELEDRISNGDVEESRRIVARAAEEVDSAKNAVGRPSLLIASLIPMINTESKAIEGSVDAAALSVRGAGSIVEGASILGLSERGVAEAVFVEGEVQLDAISAARQQINEAEIAFTDGLITLERLNPRLQLLQGPIDDAHDRIAETLARTTDARSTMDVIASLLGAKEKRRYLLAFQAPGEARATGGLVGLTGILESDDGRLRMVDVAPAQEFLGKVKAPVEAPGWFTESYGPQKALTQFQQANVSPNYPIVSDVLLQMYERTTGSKLDGVLAMDPIALAEMMEGMEPIQTQHPRQTVDASNVEEILLRNSYVEFELETQQDLFLEEIVEGFWRNISEGNVDLKLFGEGLATALRTRHVKLYSEDGTDQALLTDLGLAGEYDDLGPFTQMAFNINYAANKIDYFFQRDISTDIRFRPGGTAEVTTTLRMSNQAPFGPPSILLGQGVDLIPGTNRMMSNLLMPPGSQVNSFTVGTERRGPFTYLDEVSPVAWDIVQLDPDSTETMTVTYSIPAAIQRLGNRTVFDFALFPQASVNPDHYSLRITPPEGVDVVELEGGLSDEQSPNVSGTLDEPISVRVVMDEL
jgi:hypothetical protein